MIFAPEDFDSQNHSCTLNTILNIEYFISKNSGAFSKTELWQALPKKIMYQSYKIVIEYLLNSNKIQIRGKKVFWISKKPILNLEEFTSQNHLATLTTLTNVEKFISENSTKYSKTELWEALPKKIMYQTYKIILAYLESSELISIENRKVSYTARGSDK